MTFISRRVWNRDDSFRTCFTRHQLHKLIKTLCLAYRNRHLPFVSPRQPHFSTNLTSDSFLLGTTALCPVRPHNHSIKEASVPPLLLSLLLHKNLEIVLSDANNPLLLLPPNSLQHIHRPFHVFSDNQLALWSP
ncbi:unnamed protein product [Protopolystoma xenopodis]|uniref:Uncharacterized protein n=1 Tax=Protopolystoma xenopodis TaxID=117903 RepID=A0A3S5BVM4_9PLAT|nr:unnamed protein product [Protopolystoma xenopodis]